MDDATYNNICEIVRIQLDDMGEECNDAHITFATNYYTEFGSIPDVNFIIDAVGQPLRANRRMRIIPPTINLAQDLEVPVLLNNNNNPLDIQRQVQVLTQLFMHRNPESDSDSSNEENELDDNIANNGMNMVDVKKILPEAVVETIPLIMIKDTNNLEENKECLNCYDQFVETDLVRILPCGHHYHRLCIDKQLQTESWICPMCKKPASEKYELINI
jgi:hypothetical protein